MRFFLDAYLFFRVQPSSISKASGSAVSGERNHDRRLLSRSKIREPLSPGFDRRLRTDRYRSTKSSAELEPDYQKSPGSISLDSTPVQLASEERLTARDKLAEAASCRHAARKSRRRNRDDSLDASNSR